MGFSGPYPVGMHRRSARTLGSTMGMVAALAVLAAISVVHLGAQLLGASGVSSSTQVLLMPVLALALWWGTRAPRSRLVRCTLVALALSWLGDTLPRFLDGDAAFLSMVGAFLLAQVVYVIAFAPRWRSSVLRKPLLALLYAVVAVLVIVLTAPVAGPLLPAVVVYAVALCAMAVLATGLGRRAAIGGVVFVVSDALIALNSFDVLTLPAQGFWVMATYILAQVLLVLAVRRAERTEPVERAGQVTARPVR